MPRLRIRHPQNLLFGVFLLLLGCGGYFLIRDLHMGTALNMGPAYFPTILSGLMALFGLGFLISGFAIEGPEWDGIAWRPLLLITGVVVMFGVVVRSLGLAATIVLVVLVASLGATDRRWKEAVFFALGLSVGCILIFRVLLNLPLPVWPQW